MKNIVKKIILIFITILILEFVVYLFKDNHNVDYNLTKNSRNFNISEVYDDDHYYFKIKTKNDLFIFSFDNEFSKLKKVIKDVYYYEKDDLKCIYPIFKKDKQLNIICLKDEKQYNYWYFKDDLNDFVDDLQKQGYDSLSWNKENKSKSLSRTTVYQNNILDDTFIYIWKYNGFYTLNNKKTNSLDLFSNDVYSDNLGIKVSKYYIIPNYDEEFEYNKFYIINMTNNKIKELKLKKKATITNDFYINGIVDNKLYIFDVDNLLQYKINPKKNRYEVVGNQKEGGLYYDNGWKEKNIYDFKENKLIFDNSFSIPDNIKEYDTILKFGYDYYYKSNSNFIVYNDKAKINTYLFNLDDVFSLTLVEDTLYFIKEDTLYSYNLTDGIKPIITYDELSFNKTNRYIVFKK